MPVIAVHHRIADEHAALRRALDLLEGTRDLERLLPQLASLRRLLVEHFAGEEAADGLHAAVGEAAPSLFPALDHLFEEHRHLIEDLDALIDRATRLAAGPLAEVLAAVAGLAGRLRHHEERENSLLGDSLYTELGGRG
jgi:hypothetical protein